MLQTIILFNQDQLNCMQKNRTEQVSFQEITKGTGANQLNQIKKQELRDQFNF